MHVFHVCYLTNQSQKNILSPGVMGSQDQIFIAHVGVHNLNVGVEYLCSLLCVAIDPSIASSARSVFVA